MQLYDIYRQLRDLGSKEVVSNLAKALTIYIRTLDRDSQIHGLYELNEERLRGVGNATGTAYALQVYIHVRWPWISFAGAILVFTILFFVLVVAQSARHGVAVWKSSSLALLFHGLVAQPECKGNNVASMEDQAKYIRVRLQSTDLWIKLEST